MGLRTTITGICVPEDVANPGKHLNVFQVSPVRAVDATEGLGYVEKPFHPTPRHPPQGCSRHPRRCPFSTASSSATPGSTGRLPLLTLCRVRDDFLGVDPGFHRPNVGNVGDLENNHRRGNEMGQRR